MFILKMNVLEEYKSLMGIVLKNMVEVLPKNLVLTYFIIVNHQTLHWRKVVF